jgi:branched-chain amino acid transport system ATP-binding protein
MILEGKQVSKNFDGLVAVDKVDFRVSEGEALGLIGPNGAGKTTLFNLISAAIPTSSGDIRFNGSSIIKLKPHAICRKGIARTFQTVKIFGNLPVLQNVVLASHFGSDRPKRQSVAIDHSMKILEFVDLSKVVSVRAKDLTLSNQKRLEVARALATNPKLLLLDEIMAGLNQTEVVSAMELIGRIRKKGITIIMIEHVMRAIMQVCDRITVLHHGAKIAEGTPQEISKSQTVIDVYLGESHAES